MSKLGLVLATVVLLCAIARIVESAVPQTISYQGVLTDDAGNLVPDGTHNLTFRIYTFPTDNLLWTETRNGVSFSRGGFSVLLGETNPLNLTFTDEYWMGISVDGGAELAPRIRLASSPYSLNARRVADGSVTESSIASGQVVKSLNGLRDNVTIAAGANVTITPSGQTLTIASSGTGGGLTLPFSGSTADNNDAFAITTTGSGGRAGVFSVQNGASIRSAVEGFTSGTGVGLLGNSVLGTGVYGTSGGITGIYGQTTSLLDNAIAIHGKIPSTTPGGFSAAIRGENAGTGTNGIGVWGSQAGTGYGVYGTAADGMAVFGLATALTPLVQSVGVRAANSSTNVNGYGLWASHAGWGDGVLATSVSGIGVDASSTNGYGVRAQSTGSYGLFATSTSSLAINAQSVSNTAVLGSSGSTAAGGYAIYGLLQASNPGANSAAIRGESDGTGANGFGVYGSQNGSGWGVYGKCNSIGGGGGGVWGQSTGGDGVFGQSSTANGVAGLSDSGPGVFGSSTSSNGVYGSGSSSANGVYGTSSSGRGLWGVSTTGDGVYGNSNSGRGVWGVGNTGDGVYGVSTSGDGVSGSSGGAFKSGVYGVSSNGSGYGGFFDNTTLGGIGLSANSSGGGIAFVANGTAQVNVLQIMGGSDVAERFDIRDEHVTPGSVVSIDSEHAGKLLVSAQAFDRKVAGVVSGAGGIKSGMVLGQNGTEATGDTRVALTGRVYCWCDASYGAVEPGDLLTTSPTSGHAMKVTNENRDRAQGAILGKAMTGLRHGRGLVLILVGLQ